MRNSLESVAHLASQRDEISVGRRPMCPGRPVHEPGHGTSISNINLGRGAGCFRQARPVAGFLFGAKHGMISMWGVT